eukprot:CAMPEP_0176475156 /NCGR_PEP_ID=MMETSP0127-20121128/43447_1 /TAXON_ID=938130 /ORGANISM="Platyophrya macrostoma, Strain WH" /LENGTH=264 /DNA_ID=CAMNT_0017870715 /DNA_START=35 /DNA_END=829 /DNA_ORIENTATION=+
MSQKITTTTAIESIATERSNPESLSEGKHFNGRWTKEEHQRFVEALKIHGKNWKKVEEFVATRSGAQIRSHAQKFFIRLEKDVKAEQGKGKNVKSVRKISESSISTHHTQDENFSDNEKAEDTFKGNLPMISEVSAGNEFVSQEKSEDDTIKSSKAHILSKISSAQEKIKEYENTVKKIVTLYEGKQADASINTTTTTFRSPFSGQLRPHQTVYLDLMNYFTQLNKTPRSLKLSDFVAFPGSNDEDDEANSYEFPVGGKRVKQC